MTMTEENITTEYVVPIQNFRVLASLGALAGTDRDVLVKRADYNGPALMVETPKGPQVVALGHADLTYPNVERLLEPARGSDTFEAAAFNPVFLARFAKAYPHDSTSALRFTTMSHDKPARLVARCGDAEIEFLLMPVRVS